MPKKIEEKLRRQAKKLGLNEKRTASYIWGTMRRMGWKPKREKGACSPTTWGVVEIGAQNIK